MNPEFIPLFWALVLLETKHFVVDVLLWRSNPEADAVYGHRRVLGHAALHALLSLPAILLFTRSVELIAPIMAAEFYAHYHLDWLRAWIIKRRGFAPADARYQMVFGFGQFAHQMTYILILAILVRTYYASP